jgi:hypothetical protein
MSPTFLFSDILPFYRGEIQFTNFPSEEGVIPKSQKIQVTNPFNKPTGEVTALEWTSDGYILAVGWKHGWGIISVGGKCIVADIGVHEAIDEEKYVYNSLP